jgi:haloacetate dehalogenase
MELMRCRVRRASLADAKIGHLRGMFERFSEFDLTVAEGVTLHGHHASRDPDRAVVLLHGHPRTHATWEHVATRLEDAEMSVVCPDLRGYGHSTGPAPDTAPEAYCDRAMAQDVGTLMRDLGYDTWSVVGHDRGQGVAFRLALDEGDQVRALVILDGVPIVEALERADARFAELWWHWFFFASPQAERVIIADPLAWYHPDASAMGQENYDDLVDAIRNPATVRAMLEDYRAGLHIDRRHAVLDRSAGRHRRRYVRPPHPAAARGRARIGTAPSPRPSASCQAVASTGRAVLGRR